MRRKIFFSSLLVLTVLMLSALMFGGGTGAATPAQAEVLAQAGVTCENDVVVQAGDSLSKLAEKFYGDRQAYQVIFEATNVAAQTDNTYATIADPSVIKVGQKLCIPSAADAQTMVGGAPATAAPGAPVWPTTVETPLNPCEDCRCPYILDDLKYLSEMVSMDTRGYRYSEAFIKCSKGGPTGIFNTTNFNIQPDDSRDSIPEEVFPNYSDEQVAQDYGAVSVWMEPVRHWVHDRMRIYGANNVRNLDGLDTRGGAIVNVPEGVDLSAGEQTYQVAAVIRDSTFWYDAGKPVFLLDAPNGMTFVMQSYTLANEYEDLETLGDRLNLPEGWSFRTKILDQDLTINGVTVGGKANVWYVIQDDFVDSYSACWEAEDGQSSCNYRP